jgi:phage tail protein X
MTITSNSRYVDSPITTLVVGVQPRKVIVGGPQSAFQITFQSYMITGEDRLDTLANAFYGDPGKWYAISDANPEIMNWNPMPPSGTLIRIPNV